MFQKDRGNGRHLSPGSVSEWVWEGPAAAGPENTHARGQLCTHRQRDKSSVHSVSVSSFTVFIRITVGTLALESPAPAQAALEPLANGWHYCGASGA